MRRRFLWDRGNRIGVNSSVKFDYNNVTKIAGIEFGIGDDRLSCWTEPDINEFKKDKSENAKDRQNSRGADASCNPGEFAQPKFFHHSFRLFLQTESTS